MTFTGHGTRVCPTAVQRITSVGTRFSASLRALSACLCLTFSRVLIVPVAVVALLTQGCGGENEKNVEEDVLLRLGEETLTEHDVAMAIPSGLDAEDSVRVRNRLINDWLSSRLLQNVALENLPQSDLERIEDMVGNYRRTLLADTYRRRVVSSSRSDVSQDSVRLWYDTHCVRMVAERPLLKGVLLKLPASSPRLAEARVWVSACTEESVDRIESELMGEAKGYEYFVDRWVDMADVADMIPGMAKDFAVHGESPADYEVTFGGWTSLLHITDRIPAGARVPFEYAAPFIAADIEQRSLARKAQDLTMEQARREAARGTLTVSPAVEDVLPFRVVTRRKDAAPAE